ncbi:SDR family NAD(P)-dependent oxidoreductase [Streptomyces cyaneofuscatus]|uniref:SDR family NAD(P)-dependent oxidoreductase n=1 Tax=Streptomyces cyaneofuscatus TaxID=66883 RepID=UPI0037D75C33
MTGTDGSRDETTGGTAGRIAVVGIGCRLPGAQDQRAYWANLDAGVCSVGEVTADRWDIGRHYSPDISAPHTAVSKWCGLVDRPYAFDHAFFRIPPKDAALMDPQQRLLLEETWHCVEDAGIPMAELSHARTSVYVGVMARDHLQEAAKDGAPVESHSGLGGYDCLLANRVSHFFGLRGASISIDAACASSLVAVHTGSQALLSGEADYVLAGGVSLNLHPWKYISFSKARMLSPEGRCKTFSQDADGYVPGDGVAMVLLRRLEDAVREGNHIYGVLAGSAVNHVGRRSTITAPSVESQRDVVSTALTRAGWDPRTVTYVEAHGTGTSLGDPIEVEALRGVYSAASQDTGWCRIGSVKPNIGHLEAAAGVAGLIKVLMMMRMRTVPPSIGIRELNPLIRFDGSPFQVARESSVWSPHVDGGLLRAGVSSFGMGGVNAHVLVEEFSRATSTEPARAGRSGHATTGRHPFILSAHSPEALARLLDRWREKPGRSGWTSEPAAVVCRTLSVGREHFPYRVGGLVSDTGDIAALVDSAASPHEAVPDKPWLLRVGLLAVPSRRQLRELLASPLYTEAVTGLRKQSPESSKALRELRQGNGGPHNEVVFTYLTVRALLLAGFAPQSVTADGPGVWAALAAVDALDVPVAAALAQGVTPSDAVPLRAPRIPFTEPVTGRVLHPYRLDTEYLTSLRAGLRVSDEESARVHDRARRLADDQHTFRGHIKEWDHLLAEREGNGPRMPADSDAWHTTSADPSGEARTLRVLAAENALDLLHKKWDMVHEREVESAPVRDVLDLMAHGVLTRQDAIALVLGDDTELADMAQRAGQRTKLLPDDGGFPLLRSRIRTTLDTDDACAWASAAATAPEARPTEEAVLSVGVDQTHSAEVSVGGADDLADVLAGPLLKLWLRGVPLDWRRTATGAQGRLLPLPTTEFVRSEHRLERDTAPRPSLTATDTPTAMESDRAVTLRELSRQIEAAPLPSEELPVSGPLMVVLPARLHDELHDLVQNALPSNELSWVRLGEQYDGSNGAWTVRATEEGDWRRLFSALRGDGRLPRRIIHLLAPETDVPVDERLAETVYSAFLLSKTVASLQESGLTEIVCLRAAGTEGEPRGAGETATTGPEAAAIAGLSRSLRRETARVLLRAVSVDTPPTDPSAWRRAAEEFGATDESEAVLHIDGVRHAERYTEKERVTRRDAGANSCTGIRAGGVYVISGGAGGLGRLVTEYLLRTPQVRVVLVGRSELPPTHADSMAALLGGDVPRAEYLSADLRDPGQTEAVTAVVREKYGRIDGVIHAAGVLRDGLLVNKTLDDVRAVLTPKILGAVNLDLATREDPLDFFAVFSSVVAVSGNAGQTDYAAANAYLDACTAERERLRVSGQRSGRTIAIGWPLWEAGGMTVADSGSSVFRQDRGVFPLPSREGIEALDTILAGPSGHRVFVNGTQNASTWLLARPQRAPEPTPAVATAKSRRATADAVDNPVQRAVRYLTGVFAELLGVEPGHVDPRTGFDEYGIDSIRISQFNARIEQDLGAVPQTLLFECRTLRQAAERVAAYRPDELATWFTDGVRPEEEAEEAHPAQNRPAPPTQVSTSDRSAPPAPERDAIAVIGMSGRYPMAPDLSTFWKNLADGRDSVTELPSSRRALWRLPADANANSDIYCTSGGFLDDVARFDPLFFNISPREAELMDPQERIFLEVAWEAFEDAGYPPYRLGDPDDPAQRRVGVFAGVTTQTYLLWGPDEWRKGSTDIPTSTQWSVANRISYWLDLHGPSMPVDTACASSLQAVHLACESLSRGESDLALVGGVNLYLHPSKYRWLSQMQMLSHIGRSHAFGEQADGFVPGEGAGALILKPMRQAAADGDRILGLIKGTSVNHGGRTSGFTVPNPRAQAELVRRALDDAGVGPETIGYIEAHGTGTALGDPIEIAGLTEAFKGVPTSVMTEADGCSVGSVKTNIGHLEAAAGIAGLTKVLLQLRHGTLVPSLHAERENPRFDLSTTPFRLQRTSAHWSRKSGPDGRELPRRAGISSFGAGGSNAHVIVEEYNGPRAPRGAPDGEHLIVVSAKDRDRLHAHCANLAQAIAARKSDLVLSEVAHQLQVRRQPLPERVALLTSDLGELVHRLEAVATGRPPTTGCWTTDRTPKARQAALDAVPGALRSRDLTRLATSWVAGADVPWAQLYSSPLPHVDLPAYPFAPEHHWLERKQGEQAIERDSVPGSSHPLISGAAEDTQGTFVDFTGREFFLADHQVDGVPIFPAVGYLEMVRAAAQLAGRPAVRLRNNVWSEAMTVPAPQRFHLGLEPASGGWAYEVYSVDSDGARLVHGRGRADTGTADPAGDDLTVDLDGIRARCGDQAGAEEFYALVHGLGLQLGHAYQGVRRLWWNQDEALSEILLPDAAQGGSDGFVLHPSMLDSALQASLWLIERREGRGRLHLPFTIGSVDATRGTPRRGYAHVVIRSWAEAGKKVEVRLCDEQGRVLLTVRDFWLRPWRAAQDEQASPLPEGAFFRPSWTPGAASTAGPTDGRQPTTATLILAPTTEAGHSLASAAAAVHGGTGPSVVVTPGAGFHAPAEDSRGHEVTLRAAEAGDFRELVRVLIGRGVLDRANSTRLDILYAWPASDFQGGADDVEAQLADGLRPLFHLVQALLKSGDHSRIHLMCAFPGNETGQPGYAALGGFLRTLSRESSRFSTSLVELPAQELAALTEPGSGTARTLATELYDRSAVNTEVRHRDGLRAVRTWAKHSVQPSDRSIRLRRRGVYLISGGAGGIGAHVACSLAARHGARLVLAGRSPRDERIDGLLARINAEGGEARYVQADLSHAEEAAAAVRTAESAFGELHGVFHCAGVLRDDFLVSQDLDRIQEVLSPKLLGAVHLDAATRDRPLDVFCLFSSVAAPLGSSGQAGYAYANSFLDAFAHWREEQCRRGARSGHTTSMNWPLWRDGGMGVDAEVQTWLRVNLGLLPLRTETALSALAAVLDGPPGQVLFVEGDGAKVAAQLCAEVPGDTAPTDVDHTQDTGSVPPQRAGFPEEEGQEPLDDQAPRLRTALCTVLTGEVATLVKLDQARVDPMAAIGDYGFDSLTFNRLANRLNECLGVDITPATFFEYTTVDELAGHLLDMFAEEIAAHVEVPVPDRPATLPQDVAQTTGARPASSRTAAVVTEEPVVPPAATGGATGPEPIAIVGMHAEMPGCGSLDAYWRHIENGDDLISEIPADRWDWRDFYDPSGQGSNKTVSKWGGFLHDVDTFDARFFGISPREAQLMDPQQRLFLQTAYRAVEEAGYRPSDLSANRTGLFVGVATHEYYDLLREAGVPTEAYTTTGLFHAILANRVSYLLDLRGPSFPIDTACSSSLVALRTAVESLRAGSCDTALVGGVNLLLSPTIYVSFSRAGMLSPDGRCKTFDAAADGYVRGEGVAALLLKPLSAALRDGDHIHALIRGSSVNHGGRVNTLTTPNPNAQSSLIVDAFEEAGVDPETVGYMEIHGTGTALGDPIEINGLKKAFRELRDRAGLPRLTEARTAIGSVKPVIGHLEAAAGVAGIVKAVLAMKHGKLPGSPHIKELNPHIQLEGSPLRIPGTTEHWPRRTGPDGRELPRRAGVSSFGFGGTNGHVLLEEYLDHRPALVTAPHNDRAEHVFVLSARTDEQLREYAARMAVAVRTELGNGPDAGAVESELVAVVADALGVHPDDVPTEEPLGDLGLSPVSLDALREWVADRYSPVDGASLAGRSVKSVVAGLPPASGPGRLLDLAYTLQLGRDHMEHRLAVVCGDRDILAQRMDAFARGGTPARNVWHSATAKASSTTSLHPDEADLRSVAEQWTTGASVAWEQLYREEHPLRLSLPTYPFARTRYWIPGSENRGHTWTVRTRLEATDRLVAEHRIHGRMVLPGVAHIELAHTALASRRTGRYKLIQAVWLRPLFVGPERRSDVEVRLREKDGRTTYEVLTVDDSGTSVTHSRGTWEELASDNLSVGRTTVDVPAVRRRCGHTLDHDEVYERFRALGLDYGALFRGLREVHVGDNDVLGSFTTRHAGAAPGDQAFHPTVLDAALQAVSAFDFIGRTGNGTTRLPFALESADLGEPLPDSGHIHVTRAQGGQYDVTVLDGAHRIRAELRGVTVREAGSGPTEPTGEQQDLTRFLYEPYWTEQPLPDGTSITSFPAPDGGTLVVHPPHCFGLDHVLSSQGSAGENWRIRLGTPGTPTRALSERAWEVDAADDGALRDLLERIGNVRHVWFLGGLHETRQEAAITQAPGSPGDPSEVFFRLFKALSDTDRTSALHSLRVVTSDVHDVDGSRTGNPRAAGLVGLCKTLAKEYPHLGVRCIDIGTPTAGPAQTVGPDRTAGALLAEPPHRDGEEVALRAGRRFVKRLRPLPLTAPALPVYRQGGTYLIVGGTGGIGRTLAQHLAKSAATRIVLVGRSSPSPETDEVVAQVAASGGEALYVQADATDLTAMRRAVERAEAHFGVLHGVFHAAMVLRDSTIERMDTEAYQASYAPKARGSEVLGELFADAPLDFLLFLSSVQSFTGAMGQGNYAAASTAQDASARALAGRAGYPVQVVNWGVWGAVGAVSSPRYREELRSRGYRPIEPADGMALTERVLASGRRQVVALDADDRVLRSIGVRATAPVTAGTASRPTAPMTGSAEHLAEEQALEGFIAGEVCGLMQEAGLLQQPGQEHELTWPARALGAQPRHLRLVDGLVEVLARGGYAELNSGRIRATKRVATAGDSRTRAERAAELEFAYPALGSRLELVRVCLDGLRQVLAGAASPTEVVFPAGSTERVASVYRGARLVDHCNRLLAEHVVHHVRDTAPGRRPRILEIGAGTGATTAEVLTALCDAGIETDYDYTDVSARFLHDAERQWAGRHDVRMSFRPLDIGRPLQAQGFGQDRYDVVIAANVLHAVADLDGALQRARALLVPSGRLLLTEVTRALAFHTVTFGLLDGWWAYKDVSRRLPSSPLLDDEMWRRRLEFTGFADVDVHGEADVQGALSQRVVTATPSAATGFTEPVGPPDPASPRPTSTTAAGHAPKAAPAPMPTVTDLVTRVAELITAFTAETLSMPADELEPDRPLSSYGVDSIVGVELINRINEELGIVLKTIAIFDHPTVGDLAGFVAERYGSAVEGRLRPEADDVRAQESATAPIPTREPIAAPVTLAAARAPVSPSSPGAAGRTGFRAVRFERPGTPADLVIVPMNPVAPGPGEVEVQVKAFPVNFSDFLAAKGLYPMMPDFPFTPGVEVSGVVRRVGPGVHRVKPGDEVIALTRPEMGGQASVVLTDETFVVRKPANLTHEEACGMPVAFLAMSLAFERAAVQPGERVLIRAATGTNGLMAVQLAQLAGAEIIATAGSRNKVDHLIAMGISDPIDHLTHDVVEEVLRRTEGRGVDVVINTLGNGATQEGLNLLAPDGRYVEIAVFGLQASGGLDLSRMVENQSFHSFNTKKYFLNHPERRIPCLEAMATQLESGTIRPLTAHVVPFDRVAEAYTLKADRGTVGRVVVTVPDPDESADAGGQAFFVQQDDQRTGTSPEKAAATADIAVIGMSGRYAGAADLGELWQNLAAGVCSASDVPADRWSHERFHDADPTRLDATYCSRGAFLDDIDAFDAPFFNMSGKEAAQTDPQQRLFLEQAWKALEDAGYPAGALNGRPCGVFVGVGPSEYLTRMNKANVLKEAQSFWGNEASVLAARISYFLNLKGPSLAVNTACSSSLVAVHLACQSLLAGECETAVAGGVFLTLAPDYFIVASNGTMLSPDGVCKTFDDTADGFGPGEGVGALLLKPLDAALRDGDHIHGVIKGSAINQDGRTNGITAPSGAAQTAVEISAYERAGISPESISYVEAHGTGTRLGDPIEIEALSNAFGRYTDHKSFCPIGSVKTNIGHTAAAAGIAGIIKVLLSFRHGQIPPSVNFERPNQLIDFADTPFYVNTELRPWTSRDGLPRRAAVSSFGFSGTNAHLVLEEPPAVRAAAPVGRSPVAVPVSAQTPQALAVRMARLADWLEGDGVTASLTEIAGNLQLHRDHFRERAVFVVGDRDELKDRLRETVHGRAEVASAAADPALSEAAARYLTGENVDWRSLWAGGSFRRIPMPTYPFDRHRYWYTERDTVYAAATNDAPELKRISPAGAMPAVMATDLTGAEFYLTDHRVQGTPTLPGVLYLELALRAARQAGLRVHTVTGLQWLRPLAIDGTPARITVHLESDGSATRFEIRSAEVVHARGAVAPQDTEISERRLDLDALRRSCPRSLPVAEHYRFLVDMGLEHGPAMACIRDLRVGDDLVLAQLRLPEGLAATGSAFDLHPALMDGALQVLAAMPSIRAIGPGRPLLPVALGALSRAGTLPPTVTVRAAAHPGTPASGSAHTFDIQLLDDEGRVLLSLERLTIKLPDVRTAVPSEDALVDLLRRFRDGEIDESTAESALEAFCAE